jgi:hypothetical protein
VRESALEQELFRQVRALGGIAVKLAPTHVGVPDRLVILPPGRMFLVELKAEDGVVSAAQQLWHDRAATIGAPVAVVRGRAGLDAWLAQLQDVG